jgi:hypothetical protein
MLLAGSERALLVPRAGKRACRDVRLAGFFRSRRGTRSDADPALI